MRKLINYFKESAREVRKINWPDRQTTVQLSFAVILFSVTVALFIGVLDLGFSEALQQLISGDVI